MKKIMNVFTLCVRLLKFIIVRNVVFPRLPLRSARANPRVRNRSHFNAPGSPALLTRTNKVILKRRYFDHRGSDAGSRRKSRCTGVHEFSHLMRIMPLVYTRTEVKRKIISGSTPQFWFHVGISLYKGKPRI